MKEDARINKEIKEKEAKQKEASTTKAQKALVEKKATFEAMSRFGVKAVAKRDNTLKAIAN